MSPRPFTSDSFGNWPATWEEAEPRVRATVLALEELQAQVALAVAAASAR